MRHQIITVAMVLIFFVPAGEAQEKAAWKTGKSVELMGLKVTLSEPVLVGRSAGYLWFPTLTRTPNGDLLALMSDYPDDHVKTATAKVSWSKDNGLTWGPLHKALYSDSQVLLPSGKLILLPYYLRPGENGVMKAPYQFLAKDKQDLQTDEMGVTVGGWPRPDKSFAPQLGLAGFVFNGNTVPLKDGGYLATLYGHFKDTKRYSLVAAESKDGIHWKIRSTVADENCKLAGGEGPCEAATCRLKDGRLMCVFRLASNVPYGQCFSSDEGKTWTEPASMGKDVFSVQPALAVLKDGTVVLSGGRPGIYAWINTDGTGKNWQRVDLVANHNQCHPKDAIKNPAAGGNTSSYTEVVVIGDSEVLVIYDRLANGWKAIPKDSLDTNSVWVVKLSLVK